MPFPQNRNAENQGGLIPPPAQPVRRFTTPSVGDGFYAERVDVSARDYVPLKRGTLYSTIKDAKKTVIEEFPRLYFLKETLDPYFYPWSLRLWATDEDAESTYNAEVTYLSDNVDYPVFARTYTIRREEYDANPTIARGQPLSAIIAIRVDNPGIGYTKDDIVTISGTTGTPAQASLVVDEAGSIINVVLTAEGTEYIYALIPTVTVTSEAGEGAELTAIMQATGVVLVSQKKIELPDEDPSSQEKVKVLRVYQTLPGPYITKTLIDDNGDIMTETRRQVQGPPALVTSNVITGGVWTKTFGQPVEDSDYISWEVIQVRNTQNSLDAYSVEIPDLIPQEFRSQLPVLEHAETVIGTASASVLGIGELFHEQKQLDAYTYRETIRGRGAITLPQTVTNTELTEEYGGGVLNVTLTLDLFDNLTIDQGLTVVDSSIKKLDSIANGLAVKSTKQLQDDAWPVVPSRLWDDNMRVEYDETFQWVDTGTSEDADPGGVFAWLSEVKGQSKWRAKKINSSKPAPPYTSKETAFIQYQMKPYEFPGWLANSGFGYYQKGASAKLILHKIRTWWLKSASTPTCGPTGGGFDVEFDPIIMGDVIINNLSNTGLDYARNVLHDGITIGVLYFGPTIPTATEYAFGTVSGSTTTNLIQMVDPGTGVALGDTFTLTDGMSGSVLVTVTSLGVSNSILSYSPLAGAFGFPAGTSGPYAGPGGSSFYVNGISVPTYAAGTAWIGTERVIGGYVTAEKEKDIFKCQTEAVVMQ